MYIPEFKILRNQYTIGKEYSVRSTLKEYIGPYNILYTGIVYTGNTYNSETSQELIPYSEGQKLATQSRDITFYDTIVEESDIPKIKTYKTPEPQYIIPTPEEIQQGYFTRYFCKKINESKIFDINKEIHDSLVKKDNIYNHVLFISVEVKWKLSGPLNDSTVNNILIPGVLDTNFRSTRKANLLLPGLTSYITDYKKFAIIT
jgi:hypothetical protein